MKYRTRLVAVATVVASLNIAATAARATAAASPCASYQDVSTGILATGQSTPGAWSYFWSFTAGTFQGCLDGPDGANFDFVLQHEIGTGWETVATAPDGGADKTLTYVGTAGTYRLYVTANSGGGAYTLGLNRP